MEFCFRVELVHGAGYFLFVPGTNPVCTEVQCKSHKQHLGMFNTVFALFWSIFLKCGCIRVSQMVSEIVSGRPWWVWKKGIFEADRNPERDQFHSVDTGFNQVGKIDRAAHGFEMPSMLELCSMSKKAY